MNAIAGILRAHPEMAIFLTLAIGFFIGRLKIGTFKLGPMLGTLFAGVLIGQLDIQVPPLVKTIFFDLFLFATGYKVGPQFFYGLKKDALPQLLLTLVICTTCLITAVILAKIVHYDVGTAAGLLAGAFSESTVIGTAGDAIQKLSLSQEAKQTLVNNIPIAYAVTYLVGTTANVWFLTTLAPKIIRVNLKEEAKKFSAAYGGSETDSGINSAYKEWMIRSVLITGDDWDHLSVAEIEKILPGTRILVQRIRRNAEILEPGPSLRIQKGDVVVLAARQSVMLQHLSSIGEEVFDKELLDFPLVTTDVFVTKKSAAGRTLQALGEDFGQGIILNKITRASQELPFEPNTIIHRGDILNVSGRPADIERTAAAIGYKQLSLLETDLVFVGVGILVGALIGLLSVTVAGINITLSTSGGALVMGLFFGWLHSRRPVVGFIPEAALWIFDSLGLSTFLGIVGLAAGPTFISGLSHTGLSILATGLVVSVLPHIVGLLFGRYILKMSPLVLLGAQAGAGTTTTALKAIQDAAGSKIPVLGYTIPYALGNILLTAWGPVIVSLMT